jgi:hypothetical protein
MGAQAPVEQRQEAAAMKGSTSMQEQQPRE